MAEHRGEISIYPSDVGVQFEWSIKNFFSLSEKDGKAYQSPDFHYNGQTWILRFYPNGWSGRDSYRHIDVGLVRESFGPPARLAYSLSIKTVKGNKDNEEHREKIFSDDIDLDDDILRRFLLRSELLRRRSELLPDGVLTFVCTMKNRTSPGSAKGKGRKGNSDNARLNASTQTEEQKDVSDAESVCEDYRKVLFSGRNHDLILKVGDKELRAHQDILRARSRVFESMLDHEMKEKISGVIDVPDCDPNAMELFLSYVYCGKIEALDHSNMLGLYYVADKYEMMELKRKCSNFMKKSLSLTNICSVIQLALKHSDSGLLEHATGYFADNMLDIMQTVEWESFLKDNFTAGNELLMKSIKKLKNA